MSTTPFNASEPYHQTGFFLKGLKYSIYLADQCIRGTSSLITSSGRIAFEKIIEKNLPSPIQNLWEDSFSSELLAKLAKKTVTLIEPWAKRAPTNFGALHYLDSSLIHCMRAIWFKAYKIKLIYGSSKKYFVNEVANLIDKTPTIILPENQKITSQKYEKYVLNPLRKKQIPLILKEASCTMGKHSLAWIMRSCCIYYMPVLGDLASWNSLLFFPTVFLFWSIGFHAPTPSELSQLQKAHTIEIPTEENFKLFKQSLLKKITKMVDKTTNDIFQKKINAFEISSYIKGHLKENPFIISPSHSQIAAHPNSTTILKEEKKKPNESSYKNNDFSFEDFREKNLLEKQSQTMNKLLKQLGKKENKVISNKEQSSNMKSNSDCEHKTEFSEETIFGGEIQATKEKTSE